MSRTAFAIPATIATLAAVAALVMPMGAAIAHADSPAAEISHAQASEARSAGFAIVVVPEDTEAAALATLRKAWAAHGVPADRVYFESSPE